MEKDLELRVSELEKMLFLSKNVLSFDEASRFLNLSKSYLYKLTSGNLIPHYKPQGKMLYFCLLYTSPSPRDKRQSRMPSSA